jgi:hypothetical protein
MSEDRFSRPVIELVAKRAANTCSNPDCNAVTSGPSDDPQKSVNVGEAAHIFGALPGSARYLADMSSAERSDITNAIWLCRNCHKMVDSDPTHYPVGLLFEWLRSHEQAISEQLGKTGALARQRYVERYLSELGPLSYRAEKILIEKADYWELSFTIELFRLKLLPVIQRWRDLNRGLYLGKIERITDSDVREWLLDRIYEASLIVQPFELLVSEELSKAWGAPNSSSSEKEILRVVGLIAEACERLLKWEESVRFARLPDAFAPIQDVLTGTIGRQIDEIGKIPTYLSSLVEGGYQPGSHKLELLFNLPDDFAAKFEAALNLAGNGER